MIVFHPPNMILVMVILSSILGDKMVIVVYCFIDRMLVGYECLCK